MVKPTGREIRNALDYWRIACGWEDWAYTLKVGPMKEDEWAEANVLLPYRKIEFRVYPKRMVEEGESVDETCTHEWAHLMTEALAEKAHKLCRTDGDRQMVADLEEALTTDIGRLILRLHHRPKP